MRIDGKRGLCLRGMKNLSKVKREVRRLLGWAVHGEFEKVMVNSEKGLDRGPIE
jgi:hypothetical protein